MKTKPAEYCLYDVPELEETEFVLPVSASSRFEDANDYGHLGDSISFSMDLGDDIASFDA